MRGGEEALMRERRGEVDSMLTRPALVRSICKEAGASPGDSNSTYHPVFFV